MPGLVTVRSSSAVLLRWDSGTLWNGSAFDVPQPNKIPSYGSVYFLLQRPVTGVETKRASSTLLERKILPALAYSSHFSYRVWRIMMKK